MKHFGSCLVFLAPSLAMAESSTCNTDIYQLISTIVLTVTLFILILTYLNGHRPFVGIVQSDAKYDQSNGDLSFLITLKNTGNVTASGIKTDSRSYENDRVISERIGDSAFLLVPGQTSHGPFTLHNITPERLEQNEYSVNFLIHYEQPITLGFKRHFRTVQRMKFDPKFGQLKVESADAE